MAPIPLNFNSVFESVNKVNSLWKEVKLVSKKETEKELKEAVEHSEAALAELQQVTGILPSSEGEPEEKGQLSLEGMETKKETKKLKKAAKIK